MRTIHRLRHTPLLLLLLAACLVPVALRGQAPATVVYLVRHAEKADDGTSDPPLTSDGAERSRALAGLLADAGITRILSSDFKRTRDTAAPVAEALGLEVEIYDPRALGEVADRLRGSGERVLVSGHSNTTPSLVELLGGVPGGAIREEDEYDRLYVVVMGSDGASTVLLRYGDGPGR